MLGASMTAAIQHRTRGSAHPGQSRFFACPRARRHAPRCRHPRPEKRVGGQKTASGIFFAAAPETRRENVSQTLGTHQENYVWAYDFALGCAVAPNSTAEFSGIGNTVTIGGKTYTYTANGHLIASPTFGTGDQAAVALLKILNPISKAENLEYGSIIQQGDIFGGVTFTQPLSIKQSGRAALDMSDVGLFDSAIGLLHTHGNGIGRWTDSLFSEQDISTLRSNGLPGYLGTPSGDFYRFNPGSNTLYRYDSGSGGFKYVPTTFDPTYNTYVPNDLPRKP